MKNDHISTLNSAKYHFFFLDNMTAPEVEAGDNHIFCHGHCDSHKRAEDEKGTKQATISSSSQPAAAVARTTSSSQPPIAIVQANHAIAAGASILLCSVQMILMMASKNS